MVNPNKILWRWRTYREQYGLESNIHEMRHTMISAVENDMPEPLLKRVVGHGKTMDTHGIYGHEVDGDLDRAAEICEEVFAKWLGPVSNFDPK